MSVARRAKSGVVETRSQRYRVAWIPLVHSPIPGFSACAVQAVPFGPRPTRAVRLVLYERVGPLPDNGGVTRAA